VIPTCGAAQCDIEPSYSPLQKLLFRMAPGLPACCCYSALLLLAYNLAGPTAINPPSVEDDVVCMLQLRPQLEAAENSSRPKLHEEVAARPQVMQHGDRVSSAAAMGGKHRANDTSKDSVRVDTAHGLGRNVSGLQVESLAAVQVGAQLTSRTAARHRSKVRSMLRIRTKSSIFGMILALACVFVIFLIGWFLSHGGSWQALKDDPMKALRTSAKDAAVSLDENMTEAFPQERGFQATVKRETSQLSQAASDLFGEAGCCNLQDADSSKKPRFTKNKANPLGCC